MNNTQVTGIVISSMPIGEYDRRIEILTKELGRISAFARGARKPSSPFVASTRVFAFGRFTLFQGKNSFTINLANISEYFIELSDDFELNCYGSYFLEIARYFTQENLEADDTIELLYYSLKALISDKFSNRLVRTIFELKMIDINGIYKRPDNALMSAACAHAFDHVTENDVKNIYSFRLADDVQSEFERCVKNMLEKIVDKKFKSLEMLEGI